MTDSPLSRRLFIAKAAPLVVATAMPPVATLATRLGHRTYARHSAIGRGTTRGGLTLACAAAATIETMPRSFAPLVLLTTHLLCKQVSTLANPRRVSRALRRSSRHRHPCA